MTKQHQIQEYIKGNVTKTKDELGNVVTWTPKAIKEFAEHYYKQKLRIGGVVSSLKKICDEHNLDTEDVLLEYDKKLNGFEVIYDEGIKQTFYVRKGFIQL